jgi:hypothetical protein
MNSSNRLPLRRLAVIVVAAMAVGLLAIPEPDPETPRGAGRAPFVWDQDTLWQSLETQFVAARALDPSQLDARIDLGLAELRGAVADLSRAPRGPDDPALKHLETELFRLAPLVAVRPGRHEAYVDVASEARRALRLLARTWNLNSPTARDRLYRLLYGVRLAVETLLLQRGPAAPEKALVRRHDVPSVTPAATLLGVTLHSGDVLVSRGGAPTSSLISRGNDHPGSFSHVALAHVDAVSGEVTLIESLIERGVVTSSLHNYLKDGKLRLMLLRARPDLPALVDDPARPHRAAEAALAEARRRRIPYDFAMDHADPSRLFCSEVVSTAYAAVGVRLWMGMSYLSAPTVTAWLGSVGVRFFETQEPADLEYDPQLEVVAEWCDHGRLLDAHLHDAVTDVLLEEAPVGRPLPYTRWKLPLARLAKAYSVGLNTFGRLGPIPEGMSATSALRAERYGEVHTQRVARLRERASAFARERGYLPPYWELIRLARTSGPTPGGE